MGSASESGAELFALSYCGFGLGLARLLMVMLGRISLRETTFLLRTPNRLQP